MTVQTRLEKAADGESWNLYVNGAPALTYESYGVCCAVEAALREAKPQGYYSEAAEVADVIRKSLCTCPGPLDPPYASTWGHYNGPVPCPLAGRRA